MKLEVPDQRQKCPVFYQKFISDKPPISGSIALEKLPDSFLPGWSKTGRRTRPGKWDKLSEKGAYKFSILENGKPAKQNLPPKKRKLVNNYKITNPGPESSKKGKNSSNSIPFDYKLPNIRDSKPHICDICKRCFKSYQALGGHKAHHNYKGQKIVKFTAEDNEFSTTDSVVAYAEEQHKCPLCSKMFSKGQALGGHKRHCRSKERKYSSGVFSFDLNSLPSE